MPRADTNTAVSDFPAPIPPVIPRVIISKKERWRIEILQRF
jgi:hypothetical protein